MGGELVMNLVPWESTVRVFYSQFAPGSLPVLLTIPDPPQSHSITLIQAELLIVSMRNRSWSHSISLNPNPH